MKQHFRIGTRGSKLALYQAYRVKDALEEKYPEKTFEIVVIKTKGDKILDVPLSKIGDKGLFTKELEVAMFNDEIDMAVHSLKDLPTVFPKGTKLGAVLKRAAAFDALVSKDNRKISELTSNDIIATSSLRRKAQLLKMNKDLTIVEIRGNVNTRIRKMQEGYCDAMVMAAAGLQRLEMDEHISEIIDPETMIPACAQGAIAIEIKDDDPATEVLITGINHEETMIAAEAERTFLRTLEGGCQIPVGSYSAIQGEEFTITGFISNLDGSIFLKDSYSGSVSEASRIAFKLADKLLKEGGKEILEEIKSNYEPQTGELPLKGKTIISTRAADADEELTRMLQSRGANVINCPMIVIETTELTAGDKQVLGQLDRFDWLFFTSRNGVIHFFRQLMDLQGGTSLPASLKIAVIGSKTAAELDYYGYAPNFTASGNTSHEFAAEFKKQVNPENKKLLLALGNLAGDALEKELTADNEIQRLEVYQTVQPEKIEEKAANLISNDRYDCILFTSPSTFNNFYERMESRLSAPLKMASIGPTTTKAIEAKGLAPVVTAKDSSAEGFFSSIVDYFQKN
ncbi:hydroxymethylbilane synthase [Maribellus mangrovi]|uniref:hydroxymethylbilane synthase n=1 Tax=Maribellus mangrovi TaxID=3133146 RepID=UPI0030EB1A08